MADAITPGVGHHHHHHHHHDEQDKEKRRKKQRKRMEKILATAWQLDDAKSSSFQEDPRSTTQVVLSLTTIGQKIDEDLYRLGRHGWEDFAADLGGVYNRHIKRRTKRAALAKEHLEKVKELLGARDKSLVQFATDHVPRESQVQAEGNDASTTASSSTNKKKRKSLVDQNDDDGSNTNNNHEQSSNNNKKQKRTPIKKNQNSELADREERAMEQLTAFIVQEKGGDVRLLDGFRSRVTRKQRTKFDVTFFNPQGRRFRSMLEVGRYFGLVKSGVGGGGSGSIARGDAGAVARSKVQRSAGSVAEKKKLRKELERLRKAHQKATKSLDEIMTGDDKEMQYPMNDRILMEEEGEQLLVESSERSNRNMALDQTNKITRATCAAARSADIQGFPGILPSHVIPDVLVSWDFLCTFSTALSLTPIGLDDFALALSYRPPNDGQIGDDVVAPPVYVTEAHLALVKLLLQDGYSDDWWWSTLEQTTDGVTATATSGAGDTITAGADVATGELDNNNNKPVIKVDMAALLNETEDPLITTSWLAALQGVLAGKTVVQEDDVKRAIKTALKVVANKWVHAYLRKTLSGKKASGKKFMQEAVTFLMHCVRQANPHLVDHSVKQEAAIEAKEEVVQEVTKQMETISGSAPTVTSDDVVSDAEYDDDEESDDSDDEDGGENIINKQPRANGQDDAADSERPASAIPPRPPPSFVDMLLPPAKPHYNSEFINPFTWPQIVGATAHRVLHRKKRLLNEVDDYLRSTKQLSPILLLERRERENIVASRVLTECAELNEDGSSPMEKAIEHLSSGGNYLQLSTVERLCILRLLIEAAYDSSRLYEVVNGNIKQRTSAIKALEVEQRRAKREAKEKIASDEAAAREQLALEAKEEFFDEKREEIRKLNEKNHEFTDEDIEALTEEDMLDFDEDYKADYEALPKPDSFNKTVVNAMVTRMQEEAAFDTDSLRVLTLDELLERERQQLEEMEGQLVGFGGADALRDASLDRELFRSIERLQKDIAKAKDLSVRLPELREKSLEQLKDAMADGTIKVLRIAVTAAKKAKLTGPDDETGGVWAVDLMRDAALELDNAKQNKRVLDAQRDLVTKMNKCFIRTEPLGRDRFGNRFWNFDNDEDGHVWAEAEFLLKEENALSEPPRAGFVDLMRDASSIAYGARDMEEDLMGKDDIDNAEAFRRFSRREYHSTGFSPTLAKSHWGCQATEESKRAMIKILDSRGVRENDLKKKLKESVEQTGAHDEKLAVAKDEAAPAVTEDEEPQGEIGETADVDVNYVNEDGDEDAFQAAKQSMTDHLKQTTNGGSEEVSLETVEDKTTAIGLRVRVRQVVADAGSTKDPPVSRYETGIVTGWKHRREEVEVRFDLEEEHVFEPKMETVQVPLWRVSTDRGHCFWLTGAELIESASRYQKMLNGTGYFEDDAAFFSYRNHLGRFCGRPAEAPYACSPITFARQMVKKEAELYAKLKIRSYDNNWGGKNGSRALWTNSMKDYAFDFQTAKQGLLTLEKAFFELTDEFVGYDNANEIVPDVKALLANPEARHDVELETIEKGITGLWNSPTSRQVFIEIVDTCKTTGFLALALDLLCRNTTKYLQTHKLLNARTLSTSDVDPSFFYEDEAPAGRRASRRTNAWQQKQPVSYEEFF